MYSTSHQTGLVPNFLSTLTKHATLAQELSDAEVMHQAMSHLAHCKREMQSLASLVKQGRLPDAVALCVSLEQLLATAPPPLPSTDVVRDVQVIPTHYFRALYFLNSTIASIPCPKRPYRRTATGSLLS